MAQADYLEVRELELVETVRALREATDRAIRRSAANVADSQADVAATQSVQLGSALATLVLVGHERARLSELIFRRSGSVRAAIARRRVKGR